MLKQPWISQINHSNQILFFCECGAFVLFIVPLTSVINFAMNFTLWNSLRHALFHLQIIVWVSDCAEDFHEWNDSLFYSYPKLSLSCAYDYTVGSVSLLTWRQLQFSLSSSKSTDQAVLYVSAWNRQVCPAGMIKMPWPVSGLSCYSAQQMVLN